MAAKRKEPTAKAANLHFLFGTDEAQVKEAAIRLARDLAPTDGPAEFGTEIIDGGAENADHAARICGQAIQALQSLPFFGGKVVWLRNASFLGDSLTAKAQTTLDALDALLAEVASLPANVQFILSATAVDKRRTFFLAFDLLAQSQAFDLPDTNQRGWEAQVEALITARAATAGLTFEAEALDLFVLLAGERTQQISSELEKLDLYLGPGRRRVSVQDVRTMVPLSRAGVIFELGNAIGRRDARRALSLLDHLFHQGENAIGLLLAAIIPKMRNLLLSRDLIERHHLPISSYSSFQSSLEKLPDSEIAHLPRKKDGGLSVYPFFLAGQESQKFSERELHLGLQACLRANHRLVGSSLDPKVVLNQLIVELLVGEPKRLAPRPAVAREHR